MSIAVAAKLRPSQVFKFIIFGMILLILAVGVCSSFLLFQRDLILYACLPLAVSLIAATLLSVCLKNQPSCQIDIYNSGEIVLRESDCSHPCFLGEHTSLWPGLLLLHLQREQMPSRRLLIFADSLDGVSFRALSVALIWVMKHGTDSEIFMRERELL